jgi:tripartite-type tricarboxylate transporter receptor subunit TctC
MQRRHAVGRIGLALSLLTLGGSAMAQATPTGFPAGPVRILNPFPAGSGPDAVSRLVGERLSKVWAQSIVIDNRPGASGFIALQAAKALPPTGHDLVVAAADHMAINPGLFKKLPYNATRDFVPVSGLYRVSFFVLVGEKSPIKSITHLITTARQSPDSITYGSNAVGSPLHLGGAQFETATGTTMRHIPFKETVQLYQAVANGDVSWALGSIGSAGPLIQAGKLRVLAVADYQRSPSMPDVPTLVEAGGPADVAVTSWVALFAPAATPATVVSAIDAAVQNALNLSDVRSKLMNFGFSAAPASGGEVAKWIAADTPRYANLIKRTGASVD